MEEEKKEVREKGGKIGREKGKKEERMKKGKPAELGDQRF
jgi:hypothetical protein